MLLEGGARPPAARRQAICSTNTDSKRPWSFYFVQRTPCLCTGCFVAGAGGGAKRKTENSLECPRTSTPHKWRISKANSHHAGTRRSIKSVRPHILRTSFETKATGGEARFPTPAGALTREQPTYVATPRVSSSLLKRSGVPLLIWFMGHTVVNTLSEKYLWHFLEIPLLHMHLKHTYTT